MVVVAQETPKKVIGQPWVAYLHPHHPCTYNQKDTRTFGLVEPGTLDIYYKYKLQLHGQLYVRTQ